MRPELQSLSTDLLQSGTEISLLDLFPLRAMRLNSDAKRIFFVKNKCAKIGGANDSRHSTSADQRSSLTTWPLLQQFFHPTASSVLR